MRSTLYCPGSGSTPNVLLPIRKLRSDRASSFSRLVTSTWRFDVPYWALRITYRPSSATSAADININVVNNAKMVRALNIGISFLFCGFAQTTSFILEVCELIRKLDAQFSARPKQAQKPDATWPRRNGIH